MGKGKKKTKQPTDNLPAVGGLTISDESAASSSAAGSHPVTTALSARPMGPSGVQSVRTTAFMVPSAATSGISMGMSMGIRPRAPPPFAARAKEQPVEPTPAPSQVAEDDSKNPAPEEMMVGLTGGGKKKRNQRRKPNQSDETINPELSLQLQQASQTSTVLQAPQDISQIQGPRPQGPQQRPIQQGLQQQGPRQHTPRQVGPQQAPRQPGPPQFAPGQPGQAGPPQFAPGQGTPQLTPQQQGPQQYAPRQMGPQQHIPRQAGPQIHAPQPHVATQARPIPPEPSVQQAPRQAQRAPQGKQAPGHSQTSSTSSRASSDAPAKETNPGQYMEEKRAREKEAVLKCRYRIPAKIVGNSVRANPVNVLVNYLPMDIKPMKVYRYDVCVKPDRPKKMVPIAFNAFFQSKFRGVLIAYDQNKNFYSAKKLPGVTDRERLEDKVKVKDPNGKEMDFEVSIKGTGEIDLNILLEYMKNGTSLNPPTEAIQCMDVILRQGSLAQYVKAGRMYFRRPHNPMRLGDGLEMWTGLFQSAIFTSRPWINIDVAHKGFPIHQPVVKLLEEFRLDSRQPLTQQRGSDHFENMLRGLRISAFLGGDGNVRREMICNGVAQPADKQMFSLTDPNGKVLQMSVADYFAKVKNIRLKMPYMNCLWLGPRDKNIFYPMEFCDVAYGQVLNKQLNDRQLATMVKEAATPPAIRLRKIEEVVSAMDYTKNTYLREFGLSVSNKFAQIQGKVLDAPRIKYNDKSVNVNQGVWWSSRMLSGVQISMWSIIAIERDVRQVNGENLIKFLQEQSRQMGISMSAPQPPLYSVPLRDLQTKLTGAKKFGLQIVIVVVPYDRGPRNTYSEVKKVAERTVGVLTQCVKEQTLQRLNPQTAKNLLLKINAKLTGVNHSLDNSSLPACLRRGGVMCIGADVTHPSPEQQNVPSIAAVTASMDPSCFVYSLGMSVQSPKQETILEFEDIMVEHLQTYRKRQKSLPTKMYVFRDGVSEGQFAMILNTELVALYNAYRRVSGSDKKPEVLFLLVQKRHHTRMFVPENKANVTPGTVVDKEIVHPRELDFYLVSHQAIKGTARPTRYYCVANDGSLPSDEVEQLAYYLCHLFSRCSRAVSYPTPTYYAHLACLRARTLTLGEKFNNSDLEKHPKRLRIMDAMQELNPMFFV